MKISFMNFFLVSGLVSSLSISVCLFEKSYALKEDFKLEDVLSDYHEDDINCSDERAPDYILDSQISEVAHNYLTGQIYRIHENFHGYREYECENTLLEILKDDLKEFLCTYDIDFLKKNAYLVCILEKWEGLYEDRVKEKLKELKIQNIIQCCRKKRMAHRTWQECINEFKGKKIILDIILEDDLDDFLAYQTINNFSFNFNKETKVPNGDKKISLIELAALSGALKIFRNLAINNANINQSISNYAIIGGNIEIIRLCCQRGITFLDNNSYKTALQYGHMDIADWILKNDTRDIDKSQGTFMTFTSKSGNVAAIACNEKSESNDQLYNYMLNYAVKNHEIIKIGHLIKLKVNLNSKNVDGFTPLMIASKSGDKKIATLLIENGAEVNLRTNKDEKTALCIAADAGNIQMMKLLIDNYADVNVKYENGRALLSSSVFLRNAKMVYLLLDSGANINYQENDGETALFKAVRDQNIAMIDLLLQRGAEINIRNNAGKTVLNWATSMRKKKLIEHLLKHNADINKKDLNGNTVLSIALKSGDAEMADLLLKHGSDSNIRNDSGETAAFSLINASRKKILHQVAFEKKFCNRKNIFPKSARIKADNYKQRIENIIKNLKYFGLDFNIKNNEGETILSEAIKKGKVEAVTVLNQYA